MEALGMILQRESLPISWMASQFFEVREDKELERQIKPKCYVS